MNSQEIKELIDYYVSAQSGFPSLLISVLALVASFVAILVSYHIYKKQGDGSVTEYLSTIWNDVIDTCLENPQFLDITKTEHYHRIMNNDDVLRYEAYCYKAWGHVEDIVSNGKKDNEQFEPIIRWVTAYHYTWLARNPAFFENDEFWNKVEDLRKQPQMVFGYRKLPTKNGDIDWDIVCEDYYSYILSPFAPEMVTNEKNGKIRNLIIEHIKSIPESDISQMDILDLGCGPGNLIPHISNKIKFLDGVDKSKESIRIAKKTASNYGEFKFTGVVSNILELNEDKKYDLIISSNSILPKNRSEVVDLFKKARELLKTNGKFVAILPSFDTTIYLRGLWEEYYKGLNISENQVSRISRAFNKTKLLDEATFSYADDGHTVQCYHTKQSILDEVCAAGLRLTTEPQKMHYPWELTRRFDYGYFPSAHEEIWDWFIVAERGELNG